MAAALRHLSRRARLKNELSGYLQRKRYTAEIIDAVIGELISYGYLDDKKFIADYISYRQEQGYGAIRIRYDLQQKGADRDQLEQLLEQVYNPDRDQALVEALLEDRAGRSVDKIDDRWLKRQAAFLLRRGFSNSTVLKAVTKYRNLE